MARKIEDSIATNFEMSEEDLRSLILLLLSFMTDKQLEQVEKMLNSKDKFNKGLEKIKKKEKK